MFKHNDMEMLEREVIERDSIGLGRGLLRGRIVWRERFWTGPKLYFFDNAHSIGAISPHE
ncbi:hypothetical protein GYMLUDRAFT_250454 [Collybiopsis luxurians FD-317 M1]|uniref:Uncharacterized protein n=1 Tax=Collybiopsis luxurians FD-317 M1 TaxID=944289 RepID=A0A0D0ASF1_9AGAR|nr:hypothetical protein GYMLUDRAFT_250454 [Collybiopsis luxurians FD-317 M1]